MYSPTTTGKIERLHKTIRTELLSGRTFTSIGHKSSGVGRRLLHGPSERHGRASSVPLENGG
jgi:hypothetical protein